MAATAGSPAQLSLDAMATGLREENTSSLGSGNVPATPKLEPQALNNTNLLDSAGTNHAFAITGTAGFIGFHLARLLLAEGFRVHGYDGMTDYYDVRLKQRRHQMLLQNPNFSMTEGMLEDQRLFDTVADDFVPDVIVHLAAQAGVRYSLENPRAYLDSNVIGTFNVMEAARRSADDDGRPVVPQ